MTSSRQRQRRVLAHQCPRCRSHWALRATLGPSGVVIACQFCDALRWTSGAAAEGAAARPRC